MRITILKINKISMIGKRENVMNHPCASNKDFGDESDEIWGKA